MIGWNCTQVAEGTRPLASCLITHRGRAFYDPTLRALSCFTVCVFLSQPALAMELHRNYSLQTTLIRSVGDRNYVPQLVLCALWSWTKSLGKLTWLLVKAMYVSLQLGGGSLSRPVFQSFIPKLNCELYHESWEVLPGSLTLFREPFAALNCILMLNMAGGLHEYTLRKIIQALSWHWLIPARENVWDHPTTWPYWWPRKNVSNLKINE